MPFKSEKQRRFLWLKHPDIAKRWAKEYGNTPVNQKPRASGYHKNKRPSANR